MPLIAGIEDEDKFNEVYATLTEEEKELYGSGWGLPAILMTTDIGIVTQSTIPAILARGMFLNVIPRENRDAWENFLHKVIGYKANVNTIPSAQEWLYQRNYREMDVNLAPEDTPDDEAHKYCPEILLMLPIHLEPDQREKIRAMWLDEVDDDDEFYDFVNKVAVKYVKRYLKDSEHYGDGDFEYESIKGRLVYHGKDRNGNWVKAMADVYKTIDGKRELWRG